MSFGPFGGFGGGVVLSGNPLGGFTGFGFNIPQGDPGEIEAAARSARALGQAMAEQARALRAAAGVALEADGGWRGSASAAYAEISGHVEGVFGANAGECEQAAGALGQLAQELSHAQAVTKQALAECERSQAEMTRQQGLATTASAEAEGAAKAIAMTPHPAAASALHSQLSSAQQAATNAQNAAGAAERALKAAQHKGQAAYESYERAAHAAASRISAAAYAIRPAPAISGGAPIPISVTSNDVTMASAMMAGAGSLPAAAQALSNPAEMEALGCGPVSPAVVLQFLKEYDEKEQVAQIAASDRPLDDSVSGVIPGFVGQFAQGAWDATKSTAEFVTHPSAWKATVSAMLSTSPVYRMIVDGENPITAQQKALGSTEALAKGAVDWQDLSHGNVAKAAGEVAVGAIGTKGLGDAAAGVSRTAAGLWRDSPFVGRPQLVDSAGKLIEQAGVPHAGDVAQGLSPLSSFSPTQLGAGARVLPSQVVAWTKNAARSVGNDLARVIVNPPDLTKPLLDQMSKLPSDPQVVVASPPHPVPPVRTVNVPRIHRG